MMDDNFQELLRLSKNMRRNIDLKMLTDQQGLPQLALRIRVDETNEWKHVVLVSEIKGANEFFCAALVRWVAFVDDHEVEKIVERSEGAKLSSGNKIG